MATRPGRKGADGAAAKTVAAAESTAAAKKPRAKAGAATPTATAAVQSVARLSVKKTYKLYLGGAFPRSESGRSYMVNDAKGNPIANAAEGSRKDARDAVVAARSAFKGWSGRTAYNRSQIVYRIAEVMEDRRAQFAETVQQGEGVSSAVASEIVNQSIDRLVWYAGWPDKVAQILGATNPVQGPFFNVSSPQPQGVAVVIAPQDSSLLGLISVIAPVIATGNTVVVVASYLRPLAAVNLAEVLATSDVPAGVVNIVTGDYRLIAPSLAGHMDVNAIDLTGVQDVEFAKELEVAAVDNLKRVVRPGVFSEGDFTTKPGIERMSAFLETHTVWHPVGV